MHNQVRVPAEDPEGRKKLAGYMLRAPMSLEKMTYDAADRHGDLPLQDAPGSQAQLPGHAGRPVAGAALPPHPGSLRASGALRRLVFEPGTGRAGEGAEGQRYARTPTAPVEPVSEFAARAKAAWARLIRKVYEVDPLECPKCKGPMRVIALIDDPGVVRRILEHLGRWTPEATEPGPPTAPPEWPASAAIPLTYHSGP